MKGNVYRPDGPNVVFSDRAVFVLKLEVDKLEPEIQREAAPKEFIYGIFNQKGERLALVSDSKTGFILARQNDYKPTWMQ